MVAVDGNQCGVLVTTDRNGKLCVWDTAKRSKLHEVDAPDQRTYMKAMPPGVTTLDGTAFVTWCKAKGMAGWGFGEGG